MKIYAWKDLVQHAQEHSPYYRELYQGLKNIESLSQVPIVDQTSFWRANCVQENRVLTAKMTDGIVFKSGGTTGSPKFSVYTKDEWRAFTEMFGACMCKAGLGKGDRIANLFYVGELYASFIFIMKSIEAAPIPAVQFPIGGKAEQDETLRMLQEFEINVLAGLPTTIVSLAEKYSQTQAAYPGIRIEKILFGGESMYPDQHRRLQDIFPGVKIASVGYASVDAGLLGYADSSCINDEHRVYSNATVFEIVDEHTQEPIEEINRPGKILLTNLTRALMPIIRYPAGDCAMWKEPNSDGNPDRKFLILGRSEEAARAGPVSIYYEDMRTMLESLNLGVQLIGFQIVMRHFDAKDALILKIASADSRDYTELSETIRQRLHRERPMFARAVDDRIIHPLSIEWAGAADVLINPRSGKLRRVIDQRHQENLQT